MKIRVYNYPWSGRLGGHMLGCCVSCGDSGPSFQISSKGDQCLKCRRDTQPIPELLEKLTREIERRAKIWCLAHNIDYDATIESYEKNIGPMEQEEFSDNWKIDYTVYTGPKVEPRHYFDVEGKTPKNPRIYW